MTRMLEFLSDIDMKFIGRCFRPLTQESVAPHHHRIWEFHYVSEGRCGFLMGDAVVPIRTGDLFGIPPELNHGVHMRHRNDWLLQYIVHLEPENDEDLRLLELWRVDDGLKVRNVGGRRHGLFAALGPSADPWKKKAGELRFMAFLCHQVSEEGEPHSAIGECLRIMEAKITESCSLEELADAVKLSRSHLVRLFKKETGSTPLATFLNMKMNLAAEILRNPNLSIEAVGARVGLPDPAQFSRTFKRYLGASPLQYRRSSRVG